MMAKRLLALLMLCAGMTLCSVSGCYAPIDLRPVQGPSASSTSVLDLQWNESPHSHELKVTMPSGEACVGDWVLVRRAPNQRAGRSQGAQPLFDLAPVWDALYGPGYLTKLMRRTRFHKQAVLKGSQGTIIKVDFYQPTALYHFRYLWIIGAAEDNTGNKYKASPAQYLWADSSRWVK